MRVRFSPSGRLQFLTALAYVHGDKDGHELVCGAGHPVLLTEQPGPRWLASRIELSVSPASLRYF